ncbi:MAG: molybdopterin-dependent oxidoreductase [Actinomycetota bacterium]
MSTRRTNLGLLLALGLAFASGIAAFGIGSGWNRWATAAHAIAGFLIVVLTPWKSFIVRRGLTRGRSDAWVSLGFLSLVVVAIVSGLVHAAGFAGTFTITPMQVHVGAALVSLPLALWHVVRRPVRATKTDLSRRRLLKAGAFVAGASVSYAATEGLIRIAGLPGSGRRFTGSLERGSHHPDAMPVTQWLNDRVPAIDPGTWRLQIGPRSLTYEELTAFDDRVVATLDCTGGWFATQEWEGAWLGGLLEAGDARSVVATSVTGYGRRFPAADLARMFLATRVEGEALSPGHGFPVRLVVPGRRGFWWIKWLTSVDTSTVPWWFQSPFPLT